MWNHSQLRRRKRQSLVNVPQGKTYEGRRRNLGHCELVHRPRKCLPGNRKRLCKLGQTVVELDVHRLNTLKSDISSKEAETSHEFPRGGLERREHHMSYSQQ